jgi:hypothetical protein
MLKALSILALAVSVLLLLVFGLDLALGLPFYGANITMDIGFVVFSAVLGYLSWTTLRECS